MGTKTISIMDDVYDLLLKHKSQNESFSDEIRRILSAETSKPLSHYFGLLAEKEAEYMKSDLQKIRDYNRQALKKRLE